MSTETATPTTKAKVKKSTTTTVVSKATKSPEGRQYNHHYGDEAHTDSTDSYIVVNKERGLI